jgi:hypothetical protein
MFGMFQKKGMGFKQIQRKKRMDRALQLACIGTLLTGVATAVKILVGMLERATGQSPKVVSLGMLFVGLVASAIKKKSAPKEATGTA